MSPVFYGLEKDACSLLHIGRANKSLGDKCSVPTGPRSSYADNSVGLILTVDGLTCAWIFQFRNVSVVEARSPCAQNLQTAILFRLSWIMTTL